jgi:hypothetical protein
MFSEHTRLKSKKFLKKKTLGTSGGTSTQSAESAIYLVSVETSNLNPTPEQVIRA